MFIRMGETISKKRGNCAKKWGRKKERTKVFHRNGWMILQKRNSLFRRSLQVQVLVEFVVINVFFHEDAEAVIVDYS